MSVLIPAIFISAFWLVVMIDLYGKTLRRPLPHREAHVCQGGDVEAEEAGTRLLEWILDEAGRQAKISGWEERVTK